MPLTTIIFRVEPEIAEKIDALAMTWGVTRSEALRRIVKYYLFKEYPEPKNKKPKQKTIKIVIGEDT